MNRKKLEERKHNIELIVDNVRRDYPHGSFGNSIFLSQRLSQGSYNLQYTNTGIQSETDYYITIARIDLNRKEPIVYTDNVSDEILNKFVKSYFEKHGGININLRKRDESRDIYHDLFGWIKCFCLQQFI